MGLERKRALRAAAANAVRYGRRRPEETTLYRVVQENLETFLAEVEAGGAASLPQFVKDEFDAFLECGILAHGFLRVRCTACGHEKLVAFSCKRRGICPSCGARRMAETAAWLVDRVIPKVPVRQWVLSFPILLRSVFAVHPELLAPVLQIIHRVIATHLIKQAGIKRSEAATGAVTLIQRFGSAANLNIHLHALVLDGVYRTGAEAPVFHSAPAPTGEELQALLDKIIACILRVLTRLGHLVEEEGLTYVADAHGIIDPENVLAPLQAASCTWRIAFGPRAGRKVRVVAVEPAACPSLTRGKFAYDFGDTAHLTPLTKMHTLGSTFTPPGFHAGGLRYHGMAPLVSHLKELGLIEAVAYTQLQCFEAGVRFARAEGILPAPEANHAVRGAIVEALRCKVEGKAQTILFNLCGHGHFDMQAYIDYHAGKLVDQSYDEAELAMALAALPSVPA